MTWRAVIFDVYRTLIRITLPKNDPETGWIKLRQSAAAAGYTLSLEAFNKAIHAVVADHHAAAKEAGIANPEVYWPDVLAEVLPEFAKATAEEQMTFMCRHVALSRTIDLMPGTAEILQRLIDQKIPMGIASNAQPYTLHEFAGLLSAAGVNPDCFATDLTFWSWQHGFSKPNPHVFRILTLRLARRNIKPADTLMVGDRIDNDIHTARAFGWQTWHFRENGEPAEERGGTLGELGRILD